ncbi:hypothetical protein FXO37_01693 [Capsicum annuum]|nr:hypothetical protein FXO37_01693 [Capsicum annuum]
MSAIDDFVSGEQASLSRFRRVDLVSETESFGCRTFGGEFMSHLSIGFSLFGFSLDDVRTLFSERDLLMAKFSDLWAKKEREDKKSAKTLALPSLAPAMSIPPESEYQSSTHHPPAPSDELFDITTTVDPSYIISLIRKLLPENVKHGDQSCCIDKSENMKNVETFVEQSVDDKLYSQNEREGVAAGEDAWEEFGCILWDLAASKTHAEFMVFRTSTCLAS